MVEVPVGPDAKKADAVVEEMPFEQMLKNVLLLSCCWCYGIAALFVNVSTTTLAAKDMKSKATATVPLGVMLIVGALSTTVVPRFVAAFGSRTTFLASAMLGVIGALVNFFAIRNRGDDDDDAMSFLMLSLGAIPQGFTYACTNNYRFAVMMFSPPEFASRAIALVVLGGTAAAGIGPELSKFTRTAMGDDVDEEHAGSYLLLLAIYAALLLTVLVVDWGRAEEIAAAKKAKALAAQSEDEQPRPVRDIFSQPAFMSAVAFQTISYSAMGAIMAATPLAMAADGFSFAESTTAITCHMLGMFIPSLFSGQVIKKHGTDKSIFGGFLILLLGACVFFTSRELASYIVGLTVVGVGWNFSFVGATTLLTTLYRPCEKTEVQAYNDLVVVGVLALLMFTTSFLLAAVGSWDVFVAIHVAYIAVALAWTALYVVKLKDL